MIHHRFHVEMFCSRRFFQAFLSKPRVRDIGEGIAYNGIPRARLCGIKGNVIFGSREGFCDTHKTGVPLQLPSLWRSRNDLLWKGTIYIEQGFVRGMQESRMECAGGVSRSRVVGISAEKEGGVSIKTSCGI